VQTIKLKTFEKWILYAEGICDARNITIIRSYTL